MSNLPSIVYIKTRKKSELEKDAKIQQHIINWKLSNALSILDKISLIMRTYLTKKTVTSILSFYFS